MKEKYLKRIKESLLFSLDRDEETSAYKHEYREMIKHVYQYLRTLKREYENYGYEITFVTKNCIENYDPAKGDFVNYVSAAWKKEYQRSVADDVHEERYHGMHIIEEEKRRYRQFMRLMKRNKSKQVLSDEKLAQIMGGTAEDIVFIKQFSKTKFHSIFPQKGSDGEQHSILDNVTDGFSLENYVVSQESLEETLAKIDCCFLKQQKRQMALLSDLLTLKLAPYVDSVDWKKYQCISRDIMERWQKERRLPTQREIAQQYARNETSVSRSFKVFLGKVQKALRGNIR